MRSFEGKRCLITGAGSGIGKAVAEAVAREAGQLVLTDLNEGALRETVRDIRTNGGQVLAAQALDIRDYQAVKAFAKALHKSHGSLDVVMNIAGISIWGEVEHLRHEDWRDAIEVNLMGPIHVIECFLPPMIEAGRGGHLVNVSSAAGLFGLAWHAPYSASKFGLRGISEVLRFDLEQHGIGVSLVCPGGVDTGLVNTVRIVGVDTESPTLVKMRERFRKHAVSPEQAARAILKGVKRNRYLVFTSSDIRIGHWFQCHCHWLYVRIMRRISRQMQAVAARSRLPRSGGEDA